MTNKENVEMLQILLDNAKVGRADITVICSVSFDSFKFIIGNTIKALEQESCDDVCEWFEQYDDIATNIVELRFSDGTVKRVKRGLYMHDIEKTLRKMLIDQIATEEKQDRIKELEKRIETLEQESCEDVISRKQAIRKLQKKIDKKANGDIGGFYNTIIQNDIETIKKLPPYSQSRK